MRLPSVLSHPLVTLVLTWSLGRGIEAFQTGGITPSTTVTSLATSRQSFKLDHHHHQSHSHNENHHAHDSEKHDRIELALRSQCTGRRSFLGSVAAAFVSCGPLADAMGSNDVALAAGVPSMASIKVTPLAHTFVTSSGAPKPTRENDATRFLTNARIVYLFEGKAANKELAAEILDLTQKRKADQGPGVTPGNVEILSASSPTADVVAAAAKKLPEGDVLWVGPIPSGGTAADGKLLAETATAAGTFVGGKISGGVFSVLLDGPVDGIKMVESGYPTSELLWYSLPSK